jgi:hypothetical protein
LWLESIAPWRKGNGNCKVRGAGVEIRRKFLSNALKGATPLGKGNDFAGVSH